MMGAVGVVLSLLAACSGGSRTRFNEGAGITTNFTRCSLPSNQGTASLYGSWGSRPIPVVLDRDFYLAEQGREATQIKNAVATWNRWHQAKHGGPIFSVIEDSSQGRDIPALTNTCNQVSYTAHTTDAVGIWKIRPYGDGANRRTACEAGNSGKTKLMDDLVQGTTDWIVSGGKIIGSSIILNFDGWNVPGHSELDIESLALHELGHVLGMLHSCNGSVEGFVDGTGAVDCSIAPALYISAVMFPALDVGQLRRVLQPNDYHRINCLY